MSTTAAGASARGSICLADAEILSQRRHPGDQYVLRLRAPGCASRAVPGSFVHLTCHPGVPMRRPLSIMRAEPEEGWLEFLYKPVGEGLTRLAERAPGETVSMLGPIGRGFTPDPARPTILALGGGVGIPPMIFLAETLKHASGFRPIVLMGSEVPFPFELLAASPVEGMPREASAAVGMLAEWGVPSFLASNAGLAGCYPGVVTELARHWLEKLEAPALGEIQLLGCGPRKMLEATATLARAFDLPCQLAVEEYMACGVGGCAGCTIAIHGPEGVSMRRVCVDGPVFDAEEVYPRLSRS